MENLYRVDSPINREQRNNLNSTFDDVLRRFTNLQRQINILAGGEEFDEVLQNIELQGDYAKTQGDYAKAEADRLVGTDVSVLDKRISTIEREFHNNEIIAGNEMAGFYGKVNGIITGDELFTKTGLTAGVTKHSGDITWLKFSHNYKTLFVADRTLKYSISWNNLQAQNLVKGKVIEIDGRYYLCRLMTGGNGNPASSAGGEWSDLIVRFTPNDDDSNWYRDGNSPSGSVSWMQEISSANINERIGRGFTSILTRWIFGSGVTSNNSGYRPVLELL